MVNVIPAMVSSSDADSRKRIKHFEEEHTHKTQGEVCNVNVNYIPHTWVHCRHMLSQPVVSEHLQKGCFSGIV